MEDWVKIFKALGDETRIGILSLLFEHGYCVGALSRLIGKSEAAVSQHIRILRNADILIGEKRGGYTFYELNREMVQRAAASIAAIVAKKPQRSECCQHMTGEHQYCEIYNNPKEKA